jgi:hypothetical protein
LGYFVWKITILRQKIIFLPIAEGGAKFVWVFRVKNHDFTPKLFFFPILGGARAGCAPPSWIRPWYKIVEHQQRTWSLCIICTREIATTETLHTDLQVVKISKKSFYCESTTFSLKLLIWQILDKYRWYFLGSYNKETSLKLFDAW